MMFNKQYLPTDPTGGTTGPITPKPARAYNLPRKEADFATLALNVAKAWGENKQLTLMWTDVNEFSNAAKEFDEDVQERRDTGATRPGTTRTIAEMEESMDIALPEVKVYIKYKYKNAGAAAQYPRYGLVHRHNTWDFPTDRDDLRKSLVSIVQAMSEDGFDANEYGTGFWKKLQAEFETSFDQAKTIDGAVSMKVADKKGGREYLKKVLIALHKLLEANYPDTFQAERRKWGWQKEDY